MVRIGRPAYNARMDLEVLKRLRAPEGQALLAQAAALAPTELTRLACIEALRRQADPVLARAALETVLLRARAKTKFARAEHMFFEREALEQASGERVSRYRAARYHGAAAVADLCAGLGGDAIGLAGVAPVIVVDRDPLRLALVEANLAAYEAQADTRSLDLEANDPPDTTALWCDPGRRAGGRRTFTVAAYQPPLERVVGWQARTPALGVKLSPGVDLDELRGYAAEREFISVDGELKECVLWFGPLATTGWRATALRSGAGPAGEEDHGLAPLTAQPQPALEFLRRDCGAALLDDHAADALRDQILAQTLELKREDGVDLEGTRQRGRRHVIGGQVGD